MLTLIIVLLMNLGIITSSADYHDASPQEQEMYQDVIGDDVLDI